MYSIHIRLYHFFLNCIFLVISVSVQGLYGPKPVKRGCVMHCVTSKNNPKNILQLEKSGPPDLVFQRILTNEITSDR